MCKQVNGKELTLVDVMEQLEAKKNHRQIIASQVVYTKQEINSARTVLDRLLLVTSSTRVNV